jgi:hypothetical protein
MARKLALDLSIAVLHGAHIAHRDHRNGAAMHELLAQAIIDDRHRTARAARRARAVGRARARRRGRVRHTPIRDLLAVLRRKRGTPSWAVTPTGVMDLER